MNHVQIWTPNVCLPAALLPAYSTVTAPQTYVHFRLALNGGNPGI